MRYDLLVIGSGPAGRQAALAAARRNELTAVVDHRPAAPDGVRVRPHLLRRLHDELAAKSSTLHALSDALRRIAREEADAFRAEFIRRGIDFFAGDVRFTGPHAMEIRSSGGTSALAAERIVLACGTRCVRPASVPYDGRRILDGEDIWRLDHVPRSMLIVGGGELGAEYARLLAALGAEVVLVADGSAGVEIDASFALRGMNARCGRPHAPTVSVQLTDGRRLEAEAVLYLGVAVGDTDGLNLAAAGLETDDHHRVWCDGDQRTWAEHISAVGDVVGFTASARSVQLCG